MASASSPLAESGPDEEKFVLVKTTLPIQPLPARAARQPVETERLLIRPIRQDDFEAFRIMKTQEEVMRFSRPGKIDRSLEETQNSMKNFLPPGDARYYTFAVVLKETGDFIGTTGCHSMRSDHGWPELGYRFRKEYWGQGFATESLHAFLAMWLDLPRAEVTIKVDPRTVTGDGVADEQLIALTESPNAKSISVLRKARFEYLHTWAAEDTREQFKGQTLKLLTYRFFPTRKSNQEVAPSQ